MGVPYSGAMLRAPMDMKQIPAVATEIYIISFGLFHFTAFARAKRQTSMQWLLAEGSPGMLTHCP
jgi:hypothetical protein